MDMMTIIYNQLLGDPIIRSQASGRIKFYEYPETGDVNLPYIVIDPIGPPLDSDFGDDTPIAEEYIFQIDVWTKNRSDTKKLARRVKEAMRALGYGYYAGSVDEYDGETGIFRDARRYRGKKYSKALE